MDELLPWMNRRQTTIEDNLRQKASMRIKQKYGIELSASKRESYNALQTSYCKGVNALTRD